MKRQKLLLVSAFLVTALSLQVTGCISEKHVPTVTPAPPATSTPTPTPTPTPTEEAYTPTFVPADCTFEIPEGATVECGFVVVPEDRDGDPADTVWLAVAVYHSTSDVPASAPVIFLQGGPGSSAVAWTTGFYEEFVAPVLKKRDFIAFDQRGAGLSEPLLDCPEIKFLYLQDMKQNLSADERETRYTDAFLACRDRLVSNGVDLTAYTSAASAADINDIITVLGYEQVNLYGISYGTRLAQTVMRDFPEIVRSAVLDSVLPLEVKLYDEGAVGNDHMLDRLFDDCAADPACHAAYPDLETVFYDLVEQLDVEPLTVEVTSPLAGQFDDVIVDGAKLTSAVMWALHSSSYIPLVPQAIYDIHDGDYSYLGHCLALPISTYENLALGVMLSVNCHEQIFSSTPKELRVDLYGGGEVLFHICDEWGAAPFDPREGEPLVSDIPTLIFAGEYDPTTPSMFSRQVAENLSNSHFFEFPGQGHAPSANASEECPFNIALAFLNDPTTNPDSACVAEMGPQFVVPFAGTEDIEFEPFTSDEHDIAGVIPSGWQDIGMGFYNRAASVLDPTQLGLQAAPVSTAEWLQWLTGQFQQIGFDETPVSAGERKANGLTWTLYVTKFKGDPVDLALTENNGLTLLVVMLSDSREHDALYETVYLPIVDALVPVE